MNDCKWTPGPWFVERDDDNIYICHSGTVCDTTTIINMPIGDEANAHLIAAAPELYEALSNILSAHNNEICGGFLNPNEKATAEKALSKARGESSE